MGDFHCGTRSSYSDHILLSLLGHFQCIHLQLHLRHTPICIEMISPKPMQNTHRGLASGTTLLWQTKKLSPTQLLPVSGSGVSGCFRGLDAGRTLSRSARLVLGVLGALAGAGGLARVGEPVGPLRAPPPGVAAPRVPAPREPVPRPLLRTNKEQKSTSMGSELHFFIAD